MKNKIKKLPETELEIMLRLWKAGESVQRNYFNRYFRDKGIAIIDRFCYNNSDVDTKGV